MGAWRGNNTPLDHMALYSQPPWEMAMRSRDLSKTGVGRYCYSETRYRMQVIHHAAPASLVSMSYHMQNIALTVPWQLDSS